MTSAAPTRGCVFGQPRRAPGWPAFSLIELIVVVAIIGVLAAIAIPRFSRGASEAARNAVLTDTANLQRQIELYAIEHVGIYPAFAGDGTNPGSSEAALLTQLTQYSDAGGQVNAQRTAGYPLGPYMRTTIPPLKLGPSAGANKVLVVTGSTALTYQADPDVGWLYNDTTGEIMPNLPGADGTTPIEDLVKSLGDGDVMGIGGSKGGGGMLPG